MKVHVVIIIGRGRRERSGVMRHIPGQFFVNFAFRNLVFLDVDATGTEIIIA